ncbi:MAG: nicotinate phosphoribosyltransferase, partial [Proteobacteria bacterium]|nr:nicotinate phosphoribosyltransferase [Pseudomonadota bacterium]
RCAGRRSTDAIARYCRERIGKLPAEYRRFEFPHIYKVGLSDGLKRERDRLIGELREEAR